MHHFWIIILILIIGVFPAFSFAWYYWMASRAKARLFSRMEDLPGPQTVLVPGTAKRLRTGTPNLYFQARMETAATLYRAGKVERFLISGDGHSRRGNEAGDMLESLMKLGVPQGSIALDEGGTRTWVSLVRSRELFGLREVLMVSQKFHLERAICIGRWLGIGVTGFWAGEIRGRGAARMYLREHLARIKCLGDLARLGILWLFRKGGWGNRKDRTFGET